MVITYKTPSVIFNDIYLLNIGDVIEYTDDFTGLVLRITNDIPAPLKNFKVIAVTPGTELYTMYAGKQMLVIVEKS